MGALFYWRLDGLYAGEAARTRNRLAFAGRDTIPLGDRARLHCLCSSVRGG